MRSIHIVLPMLATCSGSKPSRPLDDDARMAEATIDARQFVPADTSWTRSHDFDGDGKRDFVAVAYTNGAHCCYKLSVSLSAKASEVALPFELDGGYLGGLSLERPENFTIEVGRDGVSSFVMAIAAYGGRWDQIPLDWIQQYGVRSHRVRVSLRDGKLRVDNLGWDCVSAIGALTQRRFTIWEGWPATCTHADIALAIDVTRTSGNDVMLGTSPATIDHVSTIVTPDVRVVSLEVYQREARIVRVDMERPGRQEQATRRRARSARGAPAVHDVGVHASKRSVDLAVARSRRVRRSRQPYDPPGRGLRSDRSRRVQARPLVAGAVR